MIDLWADDCDNVNDADLEPIDATRIRRLDRQPDHTARIARRLIVEVKLTDGH